MRMVYLVTGAAGHLGNTIVQALTQRGETVWALALPSEVNAPQLAKAARVFAGNVCQPETLEPCFQLGEEEQLTVIHCAGIVTIASKYQQIVYDVNVSGTRNIVELCLKHAVHKLVYVSSVHALPELPKGETSREIAHFDPKAVIGLYAQTKAEATQIVLDAAAQGLNASVVHPSGICGPYDYGHGHLTQLVTDYYLHRLTAGLDGGFDFVDVRDVADAILSCCERGRAGECYLLTNEYHSIAEIFEMLHQITGHKRIKTILPLGFVKLVAPLAETYYKLRRQTPLFTAYSIYTLETNAAFSHEKATRELGFAPRPLQDTLRDTVNWLKEQGRLPD